MLQGPHSQEGRSYVALTIYSACAHTLNISGVVRQRCSPLITPIEILTTFLSLGVCRCSDDLTCLHVATCYGLGAQQLFSYSDTMRCKLSNSLRHGACAGLALGERLVQQDAHCRASHACDVWIHAQARSGSLVRTTTWAELLGPCARIRIGIT